MQIHFGIKWCRLLYNLFTKLWPSKTIAFFETFITRINILVEKFQLKTVKQKREILSVDFFHLFF